MTAPQKLVSGTRVIMTRHYSYDPPNGTRGTVAICPGNARFAGDRSVRQDHPFVLWDNWEKIGEGHDTTNNGWHVERRRIRKLPKG